MIGLPEQLATKVRELRAKGMPETFISSYIRGGWNNAGFATKVDPAPDPVDELTERRTDATMEALEKASRDCWG